SAWLRRAAVYWDSVGRIAPDQWIADPHQLGAHTRELVQLGVVTQLLPSYTDLISLGNRFAEYINHLAPEELAKRRREFSAGVTESIHSDKGVAEAFYGLQDQHLCSPAGQWWRVERATAADYMAALALALSLPVHH